MAITHDIETRTAIASLVCGLLDLGSLYPSARLRMYSATNVLLAQFVMPNPAFGVASIALAPANPIPPTTGLATGTPVRFEIQDRNGIVRLSGSVGAEGSGADIEGAGAVQTGVSTSVSNIVYQARP